MTNKTISYHSSLLKDILLKLENLNQIPAAEDYGLEKYEAIENSSITYFDGLARIVCLQFQKGDKQNLLDLLNYFKNESPKPEDYISGTETYAMVDFLTELGETVNQYFGRENEEINSYLSPYLKIMIDSFFLEPKLTLKK